MRTTNRITIATLVCIAGCSGSRSEDTVTKTAALTGPVPPVTQFAVLASRSASFDDRTDVTGGSVGVAAGATNTLTAGFDTHIAVGRVLLSPVVVLKDRATTGEIGSNSITAPASAVTGPRSAYVAPPPQPVPGTITPGTSTVTVNAGQTVSLAAGAFGAVTVNGTLNLSGGLYQFQSLRVNNDARVTALASSTVRVSTTVTGLDRARITAGSLGAGALRLIVGSTTAAVTLGTDVQLTALVDARGDVRAGDRFIFNGAIAGRDVIVGHDARLTLGAGGGFQCGNNTACNDNNTCSTDTCNDTICSHVNLPNNTICSDGNSCTQTDRCQNGTCVGSGAITCVATDQCHVAGVCNPATGACSNPAKPDRTACNDNNECTFADHCTAGVCGGSARTCFAIDECHIPGVCEPSTGMCTNPPRGDCDGSGPPQPPFTPIPPRKVPKPPTALGCYFYTASGWQSAPCAAPGVVQQKFGTPTLALSSDSYVDMGTSNRIPLVYGQTEVLFAQTDGVTDRYRPSICDTTPGVPSYSDAANKWSVQANTNFFGPARDKWVQLVIQSDGTNNAICIWQINGGGALGDYANKCYTPSKAQRAGGLKDFDTGNIAGFVDAAAGTISMVAELSWVAPGEPTYYAVVDTDNYTLAGNWYQMDGSVIGIGCGSNADFTNTSVMTRLAVSSCPGDVQASSATCAPPNLTGHVTIQNLQTTGEANDLLALTPSNGPATFLNADLAVTNQMSTTSGMCLGPDFAYVKDNARDAGGIPSNLGGQPFWESPDLFVVPSGTPVDVNATPPEVFITPGGSFDVYVRVNNDYGCNQVTGTKALVYFADPAALSAQWIPVTGGLYLGDAAAPDGETVAAGGRSLIGPLTFTAPTTGLGDGHKCLLAAILANGEPAVANTFDAPNSNQVAQRNVQFSQCTYPLSNLEAADGSVQITLTASPPEVTPSLTAAPNLGFTFDDADASWFAVWNAQTGNGTTFAVTNAAGKTTVRLGTNSVTLNPVTLHPNESRNALGALGLPSGVTATLSIQATMTGPNGTFTVNNGASCTQTGFSGPS